jgi:hypothetical protein
MLNVKLFHYYNFEIKEPDTGALPPFYLSIWLSALEKDRFAHELRAATDRDAAVAAISRYVNRVERASLAVKRGYYQVKAGKGKTDRSYRISIDCRRGNDPDAPVVVSSFYSPASQVVLSPPGPRGLRKAYLPCFIVLRALKEVAERAVYDSQRFDRIPVAHAGWPPHFKQELFDSLVAQLPHPDVFAHETRTREAQQEIANRRQAEAAQLEAQKRQTDLELSEKRKAKSKAARLRREQKMERRVDVHVKWHTWSRERGRFVPQYDEAAHVSVLISGAASYILFPDGGRLRVKTANLEYL